MNLVEPTIANLRRVYLDLALGKQALTQTPKHLSKLKVLGFGREVHGAELERLANGRVAKRELLRNVLAWRLGEQQEGDDATLGRNSLGADLGRRALGDAVEDVRQRVVGVGADLRRTLRVLVVKGSVCTQRLYKGEVVGGAGCQDLKAGARDANSSRSATCLECVRRREGGKGSK